MKFTRLIKYSWLSFAIAIIVIGSIFKKYSFNYVLSWDVYGYYLYLPQAFIHHDLAMENDSIVQAVMSKYPISATFYQRSKSETNKWVIKYPIGMAYLYLPAFLTGHAVAYFAGFDRDGFSPPYENSLQVLCFISIIIGLFFVRKILLHYFDDRTSAIVLLLIALGTNYLSIVTLSAAMPHNFLFTLFAINLWLTIKWWETYKLKYAIWLGVIIGISVAARFTSAIFVIIPVLWGVEPSFKKLWERLVFIFTKKLVHILVIVFLIFLIFLPQILYWKAYSGQAFYDSYQNPGEGLDFSSPYTLSFLFSYRKGWFLYTPLMVFAVLGLVWVWKNKRGLVLPLSLFLIVNVWVLSSWTTWWYAESFSQRPVVDSYPLMALLLGFFVAGLFKARKWIRWSGLALLFCLMCFQLFQNWQFNRGVIHGSRMTKESYWRAWGKTWANPADTVFLMVDRPFSGVEVFANESEYDKKLLCNYSFDTYDESWDMSRFDSSYSVSPGMSFRIDSACSFSPDYRIPSLAFMKDNDHAWVRVSAWIYPTESVVDKSVWVVITFLHDNKCYKYFGSEKESKKMTPGQWNYVTINYLTPTIRNPWDELQVYIWSVNGQKAYIDNMKVTVFTPKVKESE